MASAEARTRREGEAAPVSLDEAISLLETGQADPDLCVDFGDGHYGTAKEHHGLDGLLQRARGLRLIALMARGEPVDRPAHMRSGKAVLHPSVEEILDALMRAG